MSFDFVFQNAVRLHEQGKLDEAEAVYRQLLEISPENTDLLHLLGMIAMQRHSFDSAIELLYKAVRLCPESEAYEFTLAQALQDAGHPKEALEHYQAVLERNDTFPETYHNMGIIYRFEGETEEAKRLFRKAIEMRPDFSSAYVNLALMERDEGHSQDALALLNRAIEADPQNPEAYAQKAVTYRLDGFYDRALEFYDKALSLCETPLYWNGIGITYERLDRLDEAFQAYDRAIEADPSFADAYNNRANVYVKFGQHWKAEDDYKKAVKLDPKFASAFNNLGALLYDHERYEEALECYRKAFIINPKQAETCSNLAMAVKEAGDPAEAVGLYFNALALNPSLTKIHHYLAQALYDLYNAKEDDAKDTAVKLAQKWKQFFPDNPIAQHVCDAFEGKTTDRASEEYVKELFDSFADTFESALRNIDYHLPEILQKYLQSLPSDLRILDAGCGTGLNGAVLRKHARKLIGVDLSAKMIDAAREKEIYDELQTDDIERFCIKNPSRFDLVVLADVVCYYGDLNGLLCSVFNALDEGGRVFLTTEKLLSDQDYQLQSSGRFAHNANYLQSELKRAGFEKITLREDVLRKEKETNVVGILASAEKTTEKSNSKLDNDDKKD